MMTMTLRPPVGLRRCRGGALLLLASAFVAWPSLAGSLAACNTPVYRYGMYNWTPSPYRIYYIARGEPLPQDHLVRRAVAELAPATANAAAASQGAGSAGGTPDDKTTSKPVANIELIELDAAAANSVEWLPPQLRGEAAFVLERAVSGEAATELPYFAVVLPHGYLVYEGPLDEADIRAIADSPARQKLREMLAGGKAAVMLLVEGEKAADNDAAEKLIRETAARAARGELTPPPDPALSTAAAGAKPAGIEIGVLRIRRDDPAEKWLVMSLLHVEPEIAERTEPMVFSVYARGRVNPPAIGVNLGEGLGICGEALDGEVRFVLGPCACTVKHDNPGMDLAMLADWDSIALAMAKRFGSETGNERLLDEVPGLFPQIIDVGATAANDPAVEDAGDLATDTRRDAATPQSIDGQAVNDVPPDSGSADVAAAVVSDGRDTRAGRSADEVLPDNAASDGGGRDEGSGALLRNVGIGVLVVIVLLGVASFALLRRPA